MKLGFGEVDTLAILSSDSIERARFCMPRDLVVMAWLVVMALVALFVAAVTLKVDKVVPATGKFGTELGLFAVRNMQSGYVKEVSVKTGDHVRAGDVLAEFDPKMIELEIAKARADIDAASRSAWADALQVLPQLDVSAQESLRTKLKNVPNPLDSEALKRRLASQIGTVEGVYAASIGSARARAQDLRAQMELNERTTQLQADELVRSKRLVEMGFESPTSLANKQRALLEAQLKQKALSAELQSVTGEVTKASTERLRQLNDMALERLRKIDEAISIFQKASLQLATQERILQHLKVRAPFDGVVDQVQLTGVQEYVPENATLMTLSRELDRKQLEIDIEMPSSMAVWVRSGMPFRASAAGNNPEDHGFVKGVVEFVSSSTQEKDQALNFRLKGRIKSFELKSAQSWESFVRPGMQLRVEVITGRRNLMSYLLDPIEKTLREAVTEPN